MAVAIVTADTDEEAEKLASSFDLNRLRRDRGQYLPLPSVEEALAYPYSDAERASWQALWTDVAALLIKSTSGAAP